MADYYFPLTGRHHFHAAQALDAAVLGCHLVCDCTWHGCWGIGPAGLESTKPFAITRSLSLVVHSVPGMCMIAALHMCIVVHQITDRCIKLLLCMLQWFSFVLFVYLIMIQGALACS